MTLDINCDLGELDDGPEAAIMAYITSANIACGGHAGDQATMERTILLALEHGVAVGAHPGYPDRAHFGRLELALAGGKLAETVAGQIGELDRVAARLGARIGHVKPHGALYNAAAKSPEIAAAIAEGVAAWRRDVVLVGLEGSRMLEVWRERGFRVAREGFADRAYEPNGGLRPRHLPGAVIHDPAVAAAQALRLARDGAVDTVCVHGDSPGAVEMAAFIRRRLAEERITVHPLSRIG